MALTVYVLLWLLIRGPLCHIPNVLVIFESISLTSGFQTHVLSTRWDFLYLALPCHGYVYIKYMCLYMYVYMPICIYWLHYLANAAWSFQTLLWHLIEYNKSFACSFLLFNFLIQFLCWRHEWANTVREDRSGHPFLPCFSCATSNVSAYKHDIKSLCFVSVRWYTVDCICLLSLDMRSGEGKVPFVSSFLLECKLQEGQDFSASSFSSASCSVQLRAAPQGVFLKNR